MSHHPQRSVPSLAARASLLSLFIVLSGGACAAASPATPAAQPAAGTAAAQRPQGGSGTSDDTGDDALLDGALIVRTGQLRLEVSEIGSAVDAAARVVTGFGGYISASEEENTGSHHSATITYRIPSERWHEALRGLRALAGRVISEHTEALEVTSEVVDLDARIANLRASEAALQEIMNRSGSIEDVLMVQRELSGVRSQIEQLTARQDRLQQQASYGTLVVGFEVPVVAVTAAQEGWSLGVEIDQAVAQLVTIAQGLTSVAVWLLIVVLPVLLPFVLVAAVAYRLRRRWLSAGSPASASSGAGRIDGSV